MKERMVVIAQYWDGTATSGGSARFVTPEALTFYAGGISSSFATGGSAKIMYTGTAQGTATLRTETASGSVLFGTAATGWGTALRIPKNGTIQFIGTATSGAVMYVYGAFLLDEFGGTAYPAGA